MTVILRKYNNKDVDMVITASTIIASAITHKTFLQAKRSTWADPYFEDIATTIDTAIRDHLGVDGAKALRLSTQVVTGIQASALINLAEVKIQIVEDFKTDPTRQTEILNQLGFTTYHKDAQKGDQEALINLLYQFKTNLTADLSAEISTKGTSPESLEAISAFANTLKAADVQQEGNKGNRKIITAEAISVFNDIYDKTISICRISTKFYKDNPAVQAQFSFTKVSKALNFSKPKTPTPPTP